MKNYFTSKASWPNDSGVQDEYGRHESSDLHDTKEQAQAVCDRLMKEGLGGERKIFPVCTWVE